MANPTLLSMPLCVNADKNTIPTTDAGTSGLFSEEKGFQTINSLPLTAGGKAPARQDFNGIFALLGGIAYMTQRGYTFEFDATLPYAVGCIVRDADGKTYRCINDVSAGGSNPSTDTTDWMPYDCLPLAGGGALTGTSLTWNGDDLGGMSLVASSIAHAGNGYMRLAKGLYWQWGQAYVGSQGTTPTITFPISFPGATDSSRPEVVVSIKDNNNTLTSISITSITTSGFTLKLGSPVSYVHYMAIGF